MKIKLMIITLCLMLIGIGANAQEEYVVKFNDTIQPLGVGQSFADKFTTATLDEVEMYLEAGIVEYYEPVVYAVPLETYDWQWQLDNINADFPEKIGAWGDGVKVAVIDSGINVPYGLESRVLPGYDFHEGTNAVTDDYGHGTFVSSMVAQSGSGPAIGSYIVPLKVFYQKKDDNGAPVYENESLVYTARSDEIANAIIAAVDDYDCSVINLSLSLGSGSSNLNHVKEAIDHAISKGAIVIAAVGNYGDKEEAVATALHYPAAYDNVVGVGSVDKDKKLSYFSQRNNSVYVVAQGEKVGYRVDSKYTAEGSGTSYAAPQVSALAAIAKCISPDIDYKKFMDILKETATDLGETGYDTSYGYGLIDCEAAVKKLIEGRKVYISPVKKGDGKALAVMYNNTDSPLPFMVIYACEGTDTIVRIKDVEVKAGEVINPCDDYTSGKVKFMAWDGLKTMVPLSPASTN